MKTNEKHQHGLMTPLAAANPWLAPCRRCLARLEQVKASVLSEFRGQLESHERLLELAVGEAEALAWQTGFPQLVFPALAWEKARAVTTWHARQRSLQRTDPLRALAA
jgi:hypothetical protein